jgi:UDP-N-acetylglucosamine 1-carboxyvinyltransferase
MQRFIIQGGAPLSGTVQVAGAKNAVLKMMAAAALTDEPVILHNVPRISDVTIMRATMGDLGFSLSDRPDGALEIRAGAAEWLFVPLEAAMKMRSSFILLGPLLARFGRVIISNPGGDRIGRRPVDLHVEAMRLLGAEVDYRNGYYFAQTDGLRGAHVTFPYVTVMGTENVMLAACLARGTTVIDNAAREPEVDDLITLLGAMGARIGRTDERRIEIEGVERLGGAEHRVVGDRIEAGTFAVAAALTGGRIEISGFRPDDLAAAADLLVEMGVSLEPLAAGDGLTVTAEPGALRPVALETAPWPGIATDLQAPLSILLTQANGESTIHETIYEDRLEYTAELVKMGAAIEVVDERNARVVGPTPLEGRTVQIADLRAGATLVLAALVATGTSIVGGVEHVDRGYERFEAKLVGLGARIQRTDG